MNKLQKERLKKLADLIIKQQKLSFVIANIGCRPNDGDTPEPFEIVLEYFPGSEILGFELDKELCKKLNKESKKGFKFFHQALVHAFASPSCQSPYHPL
jgi:hypothetical protein